MARLPRLVVPFQPHYLIQRGNDVQSIFREESDYAAFLDWLKSAARLFKVAVHAYALLPDQLHLLLTPSDSLGLGRLMQWIGRHYVPYFNQKYNRSGTLWQGRYRATVIEPERYLLTCSRYIEHLPVQQGMSASPARYPWSSYAHHAGIKSDPLLTDHPLYWALGNTPFEREVSYQQLTEQPLPAAEINAIAQATLKGWALGSEQFKTALEKKASRRVAPAKRGRPPKAKNFS